MTFKLPNSEFWLKSGALLAIAVTLGVHFQTRYRIGIDPQETLSMTDRVFLVDIKNRVVEKGASYVFAVKNAEPVYEDGREMVKRVAGMPGDFVEINADFDITVNGQKVGKGFWHLQGQDPVFVREHFTGSRLLGDDEYWMMGLSEKSFDSRYFGPVRSEQIRGKAYGIF